MDPLPYFPVAYSSEDTWNLPKNNPSWLQSLLRGHYCKVFLENRVPENTGKKELSSNICLSKRLRAENSQLGRRWRGTSCDIHTNTPTQKCYTNIILYPFVILICSTNWLGHGHGYEWRSSGNVVVDSRWSHYIMLYSVTLYVMLSYRATLSLYADYVIGPWRAPRDLYRLLGRSSRGPSRACAPSGWNPEYEACR